ncbi:MAG: hypothetical protein HRU09_15815 [Oligoflexales bacterium]|nr:hypothetical protein [Oligoflexales bacterium]
MAPKKVHRFSSAMDELFAELSFGQQETSTLASTPSEGWVKQAIHRWIDLTDGAYSFVGADGRAYSFSEDEVAIIKRQGAKAMEKLFRLTLKGMIHAISDSSFDLESTAFEYPLADGIKAQLELAVGSIAEAFILPESNVDFVSGTWDNSDVYYRMVPQFVYPHDIRLAAADLLSKDSQKAWGTPARKRLMKAISSNIVKYLGASMDRVKSEDLSLPLRVWFERQKELYLKLQNA